MAEYEQNMETELVYLNKTLSFIRRELDKEVENLFNRKNKLIASRKEMYEDTVHFSNDFERLTEINQYLADLNIQTLNYESTLKQIEKYKRTLSSPYFGRFDFREEGSTERENIYIGIANIMDSKAHEIFVYDWRAPISSIFYRFEPGKASYSAPMGLITGDVLLKRQYSIRNGNLKGLFDCSIRINDEILQEVLQRNSSTKMRNIVETIQKEQDMIIRDNDNELLIVQGVAGSGKTSIALHRIAFLLYLGMNSNINSNNIIIISPNVVFSKYISSVLPELGEENVKQSTFDELVIQIAKGRWRAETRNRQLEYLISVGNEGQKDLKRKAIAFKGSVTFLKILDRFLQYYERKLIDFEDVYYDGKILVTRQQLKNQLLNNKIGMPLSKRLKRIESIILEKVHPLRKEKLTRIQKVVKEKAGHEFEIKSFSRLLSIKESKVFTHKLQQYTEIDFFQLYCRLFDEGELFERLAKGLTLPEELEDIRTQTKKNLERGQSFYEDCAPLLYLKLKLEGSELFPEIKQVVIDEAQDYEPMQYQVFKLLFKGARYTVLGDINQAIEKDVDNALYDSIGQIFDKKNTVKLFLNKSYRSSFEINGFNQKLLEKQQDLISFERHEAEPNLVFKETEELIDQAIVQEASNCIEQGFESIAIISKTAKDAEKIFHRLHSFMDMKLVTSNDEEINKGILVIPAHMAKGLEFDAVMVYDVDQKTYATKFDRKLLYIACTRALHRLNLYYTGEKSPLI